MVLQVGQQVGSYRVLEELSHGAYSYVYKAVHTVLRDRIAALKLLHTTFLKTAEATDVFFQEARILEQLRHPNILDVLDVGTYEGYPYIVKEFAPNGSLLDRLHKLHGRPFSLREALPILRQVGEALQFAHQHKVVHCDLKPANILFNAQNAALISDFDIACVLTTAKSHVSGIGGTPSYMAPEHFQGKVCCESDQYSLACMAYEMLTGRRPFEEHDYKELKQAQLHEMPIPPSQHNHDLPQHIEQAILKALSKKYTERFKDVAAFVNALDPADVQILPHSSSASSWEKALKSGAKLVLKNGHRTAKIEDDIFYEATVIGEPTIAGASPTPKKARTPNKRTSTATGKTSASKSTSASVAKARATGKKETGDTSPSRPPIKKKTSVVSHSKVMTVKEASSTTKAHTTGKRVAHTESETSGHSAKSAKPPVHHEEKSTKKTITRSGQKTNEGVRKTSSSTKNREK